MGREALMDEFARKIRIENKIVTVAMIGWLA
jgi:hypothetical protein